MPDSRLAWKRIFANEHSDSFVLFVYHRLPFCGQANEKIGAAYNFSLCEESKISIVFPVLCCEYVFAVTNNEEIA